MRLKIFLPIFFLILFLPPVQAQELTMDVEGSCIYYNVRIKAEGFERGCYDVKIDAKSPAGRIGEVYDPREGWKSSFYYIKDGFCITGERTYKDFKFMAKTHNDFSFVAGLKMGSRTWISEYYDVKQNCPQQTEIPEYFFLGALLAVMIMLAGLVLYVKKFK